MARPTLILTQSDLRQLMSRADYLHAVESAFRANAEGKASSPPPLHVETAGGGFHGKAAWFEADRGFVAVKVNSNFPKNAALHNLPTIQGALLLFDADNGEILAVMDSIEITVMRTAAATALAARYLARDDSRTLTICGCGAQGRAQAEALSDVRQFARAYAWDSDRARAQAFAVDLRERLGFAVEVPQSLEQATLASDVIVTCTTAQQPFLEASHVPPGAFVAAVGADSPPKNEIAPALMARAKIVADVRAQAEMMGDLHHAIAAGAVAVDNVRELADLVSGRAPGRTKAEEITVFDSTGTALEDVASAALAYERALGRDVARVALAGP